jgi:hypothetical protein
MLPFLSILLQGVGVLLLADFVAGLVHWAEDTYADESVPVIGPVLARPNIIHHHFPRYFIRLSWWQSSWLLCLVSGGLLLAAWTTGHLTWHVWLFAFLSANANEVHKWAHRSRTENGRIISFLQDLLNPVLDRLGFWSGLERVLLKTAGLRRRPDTSVKGFGPGPAWLEQYRRQAVPAMHGACRRPAATPCPAGNTACKRSPHCPHSTRP